MASEAPEAKDEQPKPAVTDSSKESHTAPATSSENAAHIAPAESTSAPPPVSTAPSASTIPATAPAAESKSTEAIASEEKPAETASESVPAAETHKEAAPAQPKPAAPTAKVADPEEDDLDDLDDILDEFSENKSSKAATGAALAAEATEKHKDAGDLTSAVAASAAAGAAETMGGPEVPFNEDEFASQLQAGMADLLGELQTSPEMQKEFENLMREFGGGDGAMPDFSKLKEQIDTGAAAEAAAAGLAAAKAAETNKAAGSGASSSKAVPPTAGSASGEPNFQDSILKAMQRMQESGEQASAAAAEDNPDDILAELLKHMQAGDLDAAGGEEGFSKLLLGMMEQLTNKEILYEPMKELHDKFPAWLATNSDKVPADELARYQEQQSVVNEIVARFERPQYSDENAQDREYIVERMQKMQAAGAPPPDLVGDMSVAQDALNDLDQGCPQQ